jgi:hypothetical protein
MTEFERLLKWASTEGNGSTFTLQEDVDCESNIVIARDNLKLDLNEHTLSNSKDIWDQNNNAWAIIEVYAKNFTISNGSVLAKKDDCYAIAVHESGNSVNILSGKYVGNLAAIYAFLGEINIYGGEFDIQQKNKSPKEYYEEINLYDANYKLGLANYKIYGGSFVGFDPTNVDLCNDLQHGLVDSFLAENREVVYNEENNTYIIKVTTKEKIRNITGVNIDIDNMIAKADTEEKKQQVLSHIKWHVPGGSKYSSETELGKAADELIEEIKTKLDLSETTEEVEDKVEDTPQETVPEVPEEEQSTVVVEDENKEEEVDEKIEESEVTEETTE